MPAASRFPPDVAAAIAKGYVLGIRAGRGGRGAHRFIAVWAVVVEGRVFVRSWGRKPDGWHRVFLAERTGAIQVGARELKVRAVRTRSERTRALVDRAYAEKYHTPGARRYVTDLCSPPSRDTTTELAPA